ncbi:MAG: hypothetical protein JWR11_541 [Mycobacterium sp.]|jgi:hypothetical protein|nr:hypothetical protein [Mycobacterium sp.]MDT5178938.1 hypothetical protein [Mycobacterium sp.]
MTIRASASLAFATTFVGASVLSGLLAMPVAHADPLDSIINTVKHDRPARCPALNYDNGMLEGAAQAYARSENPVDGQPAGYNGRTLAFLGSGDPQAAATTSAYSRGAGGLISNCDFTDFGVGFIRHEDREVDVVTIVFGAPAKPAPAPVVVPDPVKAADPVKPADPVAAPDPVDAVTMNISVSWPNSTVDIASSAPIPGTCTYSATAPLLPAVNKTIKLAANGSTSFTTLSPPPLSTYHVVLSCKGESNGKTVEFGHVEQDVTATG